ncbi:MAG: M36 family metallopeptidase [Chlamydiota bacterium]
MIRPGPCSLSRKPFAAPRGHGPSSASEQAPGVFWRRRFPAHGPPRARRAPATPAGLSPAGDPSTKHAQRFLSLHARRLGIADPAQLVFARLWRSRSGAHVRFQQVCRALPVIGALLDVHLAPGGWVSVVTGAFHRGLKMPAPTARGPRIGKGEAVRIAREDLGRGSRLRAQEKCGELVCVDRGRPRPVYKVVLPASRPLGNWVYLVDTSSGAIVRSSNTMRFARGAVYPRSPVEDASTRIVALERLRDPFALKGGHVVVANDDRPEARAETGEFIYPPADTHFDEVMAYYHLDRAAEFFCGLDPEIETAMAARGTLCAHVHAGERMENAWYDPATRGIYFGDGGGPERMNDLAKEAAVICHEYTHAVLDRINPYLKGPEADALHEGYADYFGCSLTGDARIGEWVVAGRGERCLRDLENRARYPRDLAGEPHADGAIWAGACWDLRKALSPAAADCLVYESMHFLPEFARFPDAAMGIAQADAAVFSGRNARRIAEAFGGRGLGAAPEGRPPCVSRSVS